MNLLSLLQWAVLILPESHETPAEHHQHRHQPQGSMANLTQHCHHEVHLTLIKSLTLVENNSIPVFVESILPLGYNTALMCPKTVEHGGAPDARLCCTLFSGCLCAFFKLSVFSHAFLNTKVGT